MHEHITKVTSTCFFHLRRFCKLSRILDIDDRKRLVCAVVLTRVDYCNSALADSALAPLQRVLHTAAWFVPGLQPRDHVTAALQTLHWLPVRQRITYKLCVLTHGVAFGYAPTYLLDATVPLSALAGRAHLRSADSGCFDVPRVLSSTTSVSAIGQTQKVLTRDKNSADISECGATIVSVWSLQLQLQLRRVTQWLINSKEVTSFATYRRADTICTDHIDLIVQE